MAAGQAASRGMGLRRLLAFTFALGPGLMVMLADTDAGSIVTAAQSGAVWGYRLLLPQLLLIPVLYVVQEITVRLGIVTQKGHGELIRSAFGPRWALLSVLTLFVASVGALVTEFAGIAGVGDLFSVPSYLTVPAAAVFLIALVLTGSYRRVERVGIALGLFELLFLPSALLARPNPVTVLHQLGALPLSDHRYLFLLAANVGAVIMPWMVFYQQGAVIDKGLREEDLRHARADTLIGAVVTQLVMIFVLVAVAATLGLRHTTRPLENIQEIASALAPFLGYYGSRLGFGLGMAGASLVAALVVSIAGAWGVSEALGVPHSLDHRPKDALHFYVLFTLAVLTGAAIVLSSVPLVGLTIDIEVMNAALLPIVLGFLLVLEARVLPAEIRMRGPYRVFALAACGLVIALGVYAAVYGTGIVR